MTNYERLGGEPAVAALLDSLYRRALSDPLLAPFLEHIDQERLRSHQFRFISQALGGPHQYAFPSLQQAHARLPIENRHFDLFVGHLESALREICADSEMTAEIMSRVTVLRSVIVNTPTAAAG